MRRAAIFALPLVISLAACGSGDESSSTTAASIVDDSVGGDTSPPTTTEGSDTSTTDGASDSTGPTATSEVPPTTTLPPLQPAAAPDGCDPRDPIEPVPDPGTVPEIDLPAETPTELVITDLQEGEGPEAAAGDMVSVYYVGVLSDTGDQFDSNIGSGNPFPVTIGVGQVIPGWDEGLIGVQRGTIRQLDIPADKAYGETGQGDLIPANSALTFVVLVAGVQSEPAPPPTVDPAEQPDYEFTAVTGDVELSFEDVKEGKKCEYAQIGDLVYANIMTVNGTTLDVLDSSWQQGAAYTLGLNEGGVYGLTQSMIGMTVGGRRIITIPPKAGFGEEGNVQAGLEPDTNLLVLVDLIAIDGVGDPLPTPTTVPASTTPATDADGDGTDSSGESDDDSGSNTSDAPKATWPSSSTTTQ